MSGLKAFINMNKFNIIPLLIGLTVAAILYKTVGWWGFLVIFPWIGTSITIGSVLRTTLTGKMKLIGRKVALLMILPCLLFFVPIVNRENFQLEGVALLILVGYFSKGVIHYAIAKIFGPLIWGRGFCGWACWTAAILEWLPINGVQKQWNPKFKNLRYLSLAISLAIPIFLIFAMNYDVRNDYLWKSEMMWMFAGNIIYYLMAIPLAFILKDKRAFCKILCPVSIVMKPTTSICLIKIKPTGNKCIKCGSCNKGCPMGIDVMGYISNNKPVSNTECILCSDCKVVCPVKAI